MIIEKGLHDHLIEQSKVRPRLRLHYYLRNTLEQKSQRILNTTELEMVLPIYRYHGTAETILMLREKGKWSCYVNKENLTETYLVSAAGDIQGLSVPEGQWHNSKILESGTVILEYKDGAWESLREEDILQG